MWQRYESLLGKSLKTPRHRKSNSGLVQSAYSSYTLVGLKPILMSHVLFLAPSSFHPHTRLCICYIKRSAEIENSHLRGLHRNSARRFGRLGLPGTSPIKNGRSSDHQDFPPKITPEICDESRGSNLDIRMCAGRPLRVSTVDAGSSVLSRRWPSCLTGSVRYARAVFSGY